MRRKTKNKKEKWYQKRHLKVLVFLVFVVMLFLLNFYPSKIVSAQSIGDIAQKIDSTGTGIGETLLGVATYPMFLIFNRLLYAVFGIVGIILIIAGILFDWAINPNNFLAVMKMDSIRQAWTIVRDFLNLAFILVLLYSAFCTIFQIEKYHLKKILLTLVLMALLVNFSYPIARFIIDTSNVTMYYIVNQAFPWVSNSSGLATSITQFSGVTLSLLPGGGNCGDTFLGKIWCKVKGFAMNITDPGHVTIQLLAAIIFTFILALTLLFIALLLIIRIVILAILIIFSPIGFVASIFPSTKNYADMWWGQLFKQSFFGPIMAFMIYISLTIMKEIQDKDVGGMSNFIMQNMDKNNNYSSIIVAGSTLAIPIVLLWTGIIVAQKLGAGGARTATRLVNWARKTNFAKRHGGRLIRRGGESTHAAINQTIGRIPGIGRLYSGVSSATFERLGDYGARMETQAEVERIKRGRTRENMRDAIVREHMKNIEHINTGDELATRLQATRGNEEREAILRRAMLLGETGALLNREGRTNDSQGLRDYMTATFGDTDQSARLTEAIATAEASKGHNQYMGTANYDTTTGRYVFAPPGVATPAIRNAVFSAMGGDHPQNAVRNLKAEVVVTTVPPPAGSPLGTPPTFRFSDTFENFLRDLGNDFDSRFMPQVDQIPSAVVKAIQNSLDSGVVPTGTRTTYLLNELRNQNRLT